MSGLGAIFPESLSIAFTFFLSSSLLGEEL